MEGHCIASFDIEEHHRIEAAAGLKCSPEMTREYGRRMEVTTRRLLDVLADAGVRGTFFVVGEIARRFPALVRAIHAGGHEVGSHSWDHRRVHRFSPRSFRDDTMRSKDALEQVIGRRIHGYRAPTFSIDGSTSWAIDVLAECGFEYDSSIFPVRHDRYGVPAAPRGPFLAAGVRHSLVELPLLTYRLAGMNLPVAGGGYFRLFPPSFMRAGIRQAHRDVPLGTAMLYFHPWEFDPDQPRLPLGFLQRWRTYVGAHRTMARLQSLLHAYRFIRAIDAVEEIRKSGTELTRYQLADKAMLPIATNSTVRV